MSHSYAIRVDGDDVWDLVSYLESDGGGYFVVREAGDNGGNVHMHAVLRSDRNIQAVRRAFTRMFPDLVGNKAYSIAEVRDLDRYHRYMCKGESAETAPEVVGAYGLEYASVAWQDAQHAAYWEEHQATSARRRSQPLTEFTVVACKEARIPWSDKHAIARVYIREAVARQKSINVFAVRAQINLVQCLLCPDDQAIEDLASAVVGV